jgi:hypothetical protein
MPRTSEQLRKILNMLSDERQAPVALNMLRAEAEERRVLVADLMASLAMPVPAPAASAPAPEPEPTDSIDVAVGQRVTKPPGYGLRSELIRETDKAWCVRSPVGGPNVWIPKSQAEYRGEDSVGRAIFILTLWIAREKGFI